MRHVRGAHRRQSMGLRRQQLEKPPIAQLAFIWLGMEPLNLSASISLAAPNHLHPRGATCYPPSLEAVVIQQGGGNCRHQGRIAWGDICARRPTGALPSPCPGDYSACVASPWKTTACFSAVLDLTSCLWVSRGRRHTRFSWINC